MRRAILIGLAACGSRDARPRADGAWHPISQIDRVHCGGELPGGGLWIGGLRRGYPWVVRIEPDGHTREARPEIVGDLMDGAATDGGDLWVSSAGVERGIGMTRIGTDGEIRAERWIPADVNGQTYDLARVDGGAIAVGVHNPVSSGLTHGWLVGVGDDGALRFEDRLGGSGYGYLAAVEALGDGGVAAVGRIDGRPSLVIADAAGHASVQAPVLGDGPVEPWSVTEVSGGELVVIETSHDDSTVRVERRGRDGTIRWRGRGETRIDTMEGAMRDGDDVLALGAYERHLAVIRVASDGTVSSREIDGPADLGPIVVDAFLVHDAAGAPALLQVDGQKGRWRLRALSATL